MPIDMKLPAFLVCAMALLLLNTAIAQTDTTRAIISPKIPLAAEKNDLHKPRKTNILSFSLGIKSVFHHPEARLDGTDKQYTKNVHWIPLSFATEHFLKDRYSIGLRLNFVNHQQIYDALWGNYSTNRTEKHHFQVIEQRLSVLFRQNLYLIKKANFDLYWGLGVGLAAFKQVKSVDPYAYEYGGSGELDFLQRFGAETSIGLHYYPFSDKPWGIMAEGGLMQSFGRLGVYYKIQK